MDDDQRLDRTLSEDPTEALYVVDGKYHSVAREEPLMTDCGFTPDPERDDLRREPETDAITTGHDRCRECGFSSPLAVYVLAAKEFHRAVETKSGNTTTVCNAVASFPNRPDAVRRPAEALLHNGIEPCDDCWEDGVTTT